MNNTDHIKSHDDYAESYDSQVKEYSSYGHDVLFGMCFEYIKPGETLLDLGIGTGLSSIHFAKAGLEITGLDGSDGMLRECRKKNFAKELKQYNILDIPLPYPDQSFSHIICCGVLHFIGDILPVIKDSLRMLKPNGIFAFTIAAPTKTDSESIISNSAPDFFKVSTGLGDIAVYKHTDEYIQSIVDTLDLKTIKEQKILFSSGDNKPDDILFVVIVLRKEK